jgi:hypothetical protein
MKTFRFLLHGLLALAVFVGAVQEACGKESDFSLQDQRTIASLLQSLDPFMKEKQATGKASLLRWSELMQPLDHRQRNLIKHFQRYSGGQDDDDDAPPVSLVRLDGQVISKNGQDTLIPPQYVTQPVYEAYTRMSQDMQEELRTSLRIESGFRSPAYQFYLFISRLPRYRFNIAKTTRHVALPGRSEHGSLRNPAIDFINASGINGEDNPKHFSLLAEYCWLSRHAYHYGFVLSFPEATPQSAFEPLHWRYGQSSN